MPVGSIALILHAHLPFIRHPEHARHLEEDWLFEAITETYLPLLDAFERIWDDGIDYRISMSLTPPLCEMLADELLQERYLACLDRLIELAERERAAHGPGDPFHASAKMYCDHFLRCRWLFAEKYGRNILTGFRALQDRGRLEILTCGATHGFLPLMLSREARRAQIQIAKRNYQKHFGRPPRGIWLPECAFEPGIDDLLREAGIQHFCVDSHGLLLGEPRPRYGVFRPVYTPAGVGVFAREIESSSQVWSRDEGYPGDPIYREFYRDLGFDGGYDYVRPYLHDDGIRRNLGIKYHRITGRVPLHEKALYDPAAAAERAAEHAGNFLFNRQAQVRHLRGALGTEPIIVSPYDAELFGHWWHEGPRFIEMFLRKTACDQDELRLVTPSEFMAENPTLQVVMPCASSWGDKGYFEVWLNGSNDWIYRHLHKAEGRMVELARRFTRPSDLQRRALNQAAREFLLAQASDWAFIMTNKTSVEYAEKRTRDHIHRFNGLYLQLVEDRIEEPWLQAIEFNDNIFSEIDYAVYR